MWGIRVGQGLGKLADLDITSDKISLMLEPFANELFEVVRHRLLLCRTYRIAAALLRVRRLELLANRVISSYFSILFLDRREMLAHAMELVALSSASLPRISR